MLVSFINVGILPFRLYFVLENKIFKLKKVYLKMNHKINSLISLVIILILFAIFSGWLSFVDKKFNLPQLLKYPLNLIGFLPLFEGSILRFWASSIFYKEKLKIITIRVPHKLISSGLYKYSRNPLYLGFILMGAGFFLIFNSLSAFLLLIILTIFINLYVKFHEEKLLEKAFEKEYLKYKKKVRRWI